MSGIIRVTHRASTPRAITLRAGTLGIALPLAAVLCLSASPSATAACVNNGAPPSFIECSGEGNTNAVSVNSAVNVSASGILVSPVDGAASLINNGAITLNQTLVSGNTIGINVNDDGVFGDYDVVSNGTIVVSSTGRGQVYGIAGNGDVASLNLLLNAPITISRGTFALTAATPTSLTALGGNLAVAAGVFSEEELESISITNESTITASGTLSAGIYNRAAEVEIVNNGTIRNTSGAIAIASVADSGNLTTVEIENNGTVTGDVVLAGANALRWYALTKGLGTGGNTLDNRLNINNQFGQLDSSIENDGTITGNFYYGNGTHSIVNEEDASIVGNIDVDQRKQTYTATCTLGAAGCFALGTTAGQVIQGLPAAEEPTDAQASQITAVSGLGVATYTQNLWGTKEFSFENAGEFIGNITVATAPAGTIGTLEVPDSTVTLSPHVFGGGGASADAATGADTIATFQGTLKVADGMINGAGGTTSIARTTTIAPIISGTVKDGEWYKVTDGLFGSEVPDVEGSALVQWEAEKNGAGALVIGAEVADAADLAGVSKPAAAAINALIDAGGEDEDLDALGAGVQSLATAQEVAKAGAQLAPETNFATQQAALSLNQATGQQIDTRLASAGASGATAGFGGHSGLGMKPSQQGRSNLGASVKDKDYISPRSNALWGHAFGAGINQDQRELVDGYDARLYGVMAGYDNWIASNTRLGVALGYANTAIDGQGFTAQNRTDIDSLLLELYGSVKGSGWYIAGRTGFAWHTIDTTRVLTVPFKDEATGSHDGQQFNASVEFGAPMGTSGAVITPIASLTYSNLDQDGYTERSGAGMALTVGGQTNESLVSGLGLKALVAIARDTAIEGRAVWMHEFLDTNQSVAAAFAAGGDTFTASGPDVGRDTALLGVGMIANVESNTTFQMNYDADIRQDFIGHVGSVRLTVGF